jgi:uncharacterized protein
VLRSFRVANHKSIRDEQELVLLPAYDKTRPVTPVAAIYGANASGKSNLLDALRWMRYAVRSSYAQWEPGGGVPRRPFRLEAKAQVRWSTYSVNLSLHGVQHTYGFSVDDNEVKEEWLYTYPHRRKRVIFERSGKSWLFGSTVAARLDVVSGLTRDNALFLSVGARSDVPEMTPLYRWFVVGLATFDRDIDLSIDAVAALSEDAPQRQTVVSLIQVADVGITDVAVVGPDEHTMADLREQVLVAEAKLDSARALWHELTERLNEENDDARRAELAVRSDRAMFAAEEADMARRAAYQRVVEMSGSLGQRRLAFFHGSSPVPLMFEDQSEGTRVWLALILVAVDVLERGAVLLVDEVDASLHPTLTARLINLFRNKETNPHSAQLIFTTHDTTLLDDETLARDEVWFVEKDPAEGSTRLYPLTSFHPRRNENTEGRYLAGSYGAVPVVSDLSFRRALKADRDPDAA